MWGELSTQIGLYTYLTEHKWNILSLAACTLRVSLRRVMNRVLPLSCEVESYASKNLFLGWGSELSDELDRPGRH